ncbi:ribose-5-phosphate isomerase RpiA [Clostridium sp. MSJ-4]|uniref:Ribose-5-phosphate isomerase A n=1 Tax=Clostridium simiarum TaxID=2841506 RepID=A0ABS6F4L6_9CLOT|nr:ribose-5-phosphate isomerase RpiA [Clostridium simiarum]MBU5592794.1 ribose-5-phosphate isomerase RpiA [Clostridium simiarum]
MNSKKVAGEKAVEFIKDGMTIGLGTGTTTYYTIVKLAEKVKDGLKVKAISTSNKTTELAEKLGIEIVPFNEVDYVDLTIDGADEVDNLLNGIKGGGGALLYEKLVAMSSKKVIWVVDNSKKVHCLGRFPLPVEVVPFAYNQIFNKLEELKLNPEIRKRDSNYYLTDGQHYIIDLFLNKIEDPYKLEKTLKSIPGVVETGLFLQIANTVIVGNGDQVQIIEKS